MEAALRESDILAAVVKVVVARLMYGRAAIKLLIAFS
jgi:hypothetical protein